MKGEIASFLRRALKDQSGQTLHWAALLMVLMLGMGGLVLDIGHAYICYRELQASTDAAALAGAEALPGSTAASVATAYSSVSGNFNAFSNMTSVSMVSGYPKLLCLTTLKNQGMACVSPANANAIQVKQKASVPTIFIRVLSLFGINSAQSITIGATATASMRGAAPIPYNVAIIIDTTASMSSTDSDSNCSSSRISCALAGVEVLLQNLSPCAASLATCTVTSGVAANSVDRVSIFTFPNVTTSTTSSEYTCSGSPSTQAYTTPTPGASSYAPSGTTYQITGYLSDYRTSDTAASLNTSSYLTEATGGKSGCSGMQTPGGQGTYYAGVIYAAQASLVAQKTANPTSQNVMIILSDGDASTTSGHLSGILKANGLYPSLYDQCQQAVTAAAAATTAGTKVYTVAYGAEASGCSTDTPSITPCQTMQQMASSSQYFFSDYTATGGSSSCISASQPTTNLNQIFTQIAGDLTVARVIPDGTS